MDCIIMYYSVLLLPLMMHGRPTSTGKPRNEGVEILTGYQLPLKKVGGRAARLNVTCLDVKCLA